MLVGKGESLVTYSVFPPFKRGGGEPNFENFKKGGTWKKFWGRGYQEGGEEYFQK